MDASRFDAVVRSLATPSRRAVVGGLLGGFLAALLGGRSLPLASQAAERPVDRVRDRAKRRQAKRKQRDQGEDHDQDKGNGGKRKRKRCTPVPDDQTCRRRCGPVENNCGTVVDCGPCGTCRAVYDTCNCGGAERGCISRPEPGERVPSCVCDRDFCRFDGPLSAEPTECCSCG